MGKKGGKKKGKTVDWHSIISEKLLLGAFAADEEDSLKRLQEPLEHEVLPEVIDAENRHGRTALQYASVRGHVEVVKRLVNAKAGLDVACHFGHSPLHLASCFGHSAAGKLLLESKANVNATDRVGETPLHSAAYAGHRQMVTHLVEHKVELDRTNLDKRTALHLAALQGHAQVVDILLQAGANSGICDADGILACDLADKYKKDPDRPDQIDIGEKLRVHELMKQRHENIQMLQAQSRGPVCVERLLRERGELPPEALDKNLSSEENNEDLSLPLEAPMQVDVKSDAKIAQFDL